MVQNAVGEDEAARRIAGWVRRHSSDLVDSLDALTALDAPTGERDLLDATADHLLEQLQAVGATVTSWETSVGTHVEARLGDGDLQPTLILGHYDTVWPAGTASARPLSVADGRIAGPGVFDMRGGVVAALAAMRALSDLRLFKRPISLLLTADEEAGSRTSQALIEARGKQSRVTLIPEPPLPNGALKTRRRGVLVYRFELTGREAHAGLDPHRGISAVRELFDVLPRIEALADANAGTDVNIGVIGGGTRPNVVPGAAFAEVDFRITTRSEYDRVRSAVSALAERPVRQGASLEVSLVHERPPMERTGPIQAAAIDAKRLARLLGLELTEGDAGSGSDGNLLAPLGVAVVDGLGPEGDGAHAEHEYITVASLEERTALLALLAHAL